MRIIYFAQLKKISGCEIEEVALTSPSMSLDQLWEILVIRHPGLESYKNSTRAAKNCEYVRQDAFFENGDEVALIPPVSGG